MEIGGLSHRGEADALPTEPDLALRESHLARRRLQEMGADALHLLGEAAAGARDGAARHGHAARGEGPHAVGRDRAVAVAHDDVLDRDAKLLMRDLGEGRLEPLPVILDADEEDELS